MIVVVLLVAGTVTVGCHTVRRMAVAYARYRVLERRLIVTATEVRHAEFDSVLNNGPGTGVASRFAVTPSVHPSSG